MLAYSETTPKSTRCDGKGMRGNPFPKTPCNRVAFSTARLIRWARVTPFPRHRTDRPTERVAAGARAFLAATQDALAEAQFRGEREECQEILDACRRGPLDAEDRENFADFLTCLNGDLKQYQERNAEAERLQAEEDRYWTEIDREIDRRRGA